MGSRLQEFSRDPFKFVDNLQLLIKGNNLNILVKYERIQAVALGGAVVFAIMWAALGFDSTPLQFVHAFYEAVPAWIQGVPVDFVGIYNSFYGKEMHYSAFVIYFLLYYMISKNFEAVGITKSKNVVFSFAVMFGSIAVFEWFWILGFGIFQAQPWVFTWRFPQMKILIQNLAFSVVGGLTALYMLTERFHWNQIQMPGGSVKLERAERQFFFDWKNWKLWCVIGLSLAAALFWIYYPGSVNQITVPLENGEIWQSSRMFPQTLYTVDLNPGDAENAGVWFYVQNDWIHLTNTLVKILFAGSAYMLFRVKKNL